MSSTYRNAAAAIVCFDITDEQSFEMMKDWVEELKKNVPEGKLILAIACTKADLDARRVGLSVCRRGREWRGLMSIITLFFNNRWYQK